MKKKQKKKEEKDRDEGWTEEMFKKYRMQPWFMATNVYSLFDHLHEVNTLGGFRPPT